LAFARAVPNRRLPGANQIPQSLVCLIRRPDLGELTGPEQACKLDCIAAIRLYPPARATGDQRRGDHGARVTESLDLSLQSITRWSGFVTKSRPYVGSFQLSNKTPHRCRIGSYKPKRPDFSIATA